VKSAEEAGRQAADAEGTTALSRAVVGIRQHYVGRGPARATAFFHRHLVVVVMEDTMTTAERSLAADGKGETVRQMRGDLDRAMEADLVTAVETIVGSRVNAFLSANNVEPDIACQVYSLEQAVQGHDDPPIEPVQ
jgi:uncharacterized protein YbcI